METRDWSKEKETVDAVQSTLWFRPKSNTPYKVTFLNDGGPDYTTEFDDRTLTRVDFEVKVSGGEYNGDQLKWSVTKGGKESLYGMLVYVFAHVGGALNNMVDVAANGEGRNRRYTVRQFNDLVFSQTEGGGVVGANVPDSRVLDKGC